ncbi:MAG: tRNA (adenosine(37)-N6)-dimethylallyltransferase MiaA, partial [Pseudomonadota bacterium]
EKFHDLPHSPALRSELSALSNDELFKRLQIVDPERALKIHKNDHFRLARALEIFTLTGKTLTELTKTPSKESQQDAFIITIDPDRKILHQRIASRTEKMLEEGLIEEVKEILTSGTPSTAKPFSTIGYKQVLAFLEGDLAFGQLQDQILFATRQLAKRQCTWFHKLSSHMRLQNENLTPEAISTLKKLLIK